MRVHIEIYRGRGARYRYRHSRHKRISFLRWVAKKGDGWWGVSCSGELSEVRGPHSVNAKITSRGPGTHGYKRHTVDPEKKKNEPKTHTRAGTRKGPLRGFSSNPSLETGGSIHFIRYLLTWGSAWVYPHDSENTCLNNLSIIKKIDSSYLSILPILVNGHKQRIFNDILRNIQLVENNIL